MNIGGIRDAPLTPADRDQLLTWHIATNSLALLRLRGAQHAHKEDCAARGDFRLRCGKMPLRLDIKVRRLLRAAAQPLRLTLGQAQKNKIKCPL